MPPELTKSESTSKPKLILNKSKVDSYSMANLLLGTLCGLQVSQSFEELEDFSAKGTHSKILQAISKAHIQRKLSVTQFNLSEKPELNLSPAGTFFYENPRADSLIQLASTCIRSNWEERPSCRDMYESIKSINSGISDIDRKILLKKIGSFATT